jgi:hypothetical protein
VGASTAGEIDDRRRDIVDFACVERVHGAEFACHRERRLVHVDGNRQGAERRGHHDGRQSHAAAAVNGDPFVHRGGALLGDGAIGGCQAAAEGGAGHVVDRVGQLDEIEIRETHGDELGERAPAGESRLVLLRADLRGAFAAVVARAASGDEGDRDALTGTPAFHIAADSHDVADELMPGHVRQRGDVGVVPLPAMPIAAAHARGAHCDDGAIESGHGIRHALDAQRLAKPVKKYSTHEGAPAAASLSDRPCA